MISPGYFAQLLNFAAARTKSDGPEVDKDESGSEVSKDCMIAVTCC